VTTEGSGFGGRMLVVRVVPNPKADRGIEFPDGTGVLDEFGDSRLRRAGHPAGLSRATPIAPITTTGSHQSEEYA